MGFLFVSGCLVGSVSLPFQANHSKIKTLNDFSENDRIAVPAAGVGFQSRTLQIETAKEQRGLFLDSVRGTQ